MDFDILMVADPLGHRNGRIEPAKLRLWEGYDVDIVLILVGRGPPRWFYRYKSPHRPLDLSQGSGLTPFTLPKKRAARRRLKFKLGNTRKGVRYGGEDATPDAITEEHLSS
jgi:hypothetical protein